MGPGAVNRFGCVWPAHRSPFRARRSKVMSAGRLPTISAALARGCEGVGTILLYSSNVPVPHAGREQPFSWLPPGGKQMYVLSLRS